MKQEWRDIAFQALYSSPTAITAWLTQLTVAEWMAIILGVLQALYLLRKWWREETAFGIWLKRRLKRDDSRPPGDQLDHSDQP